MAQTHLYDMIVVGGGPGGYTAALYAARAGLDVLVLEKLSAGGQMALTETIDNYPGFPEGIDGFTLAEAMQQQAERFGAHSEYAEVEAMDLTASPKVLQTSAGTFTAKTVVIATGADPRPLGLAAEAALTGRGVAYCAACDGMRYKGKTVVVVGGGNSAAEDALLLTRIAKKSFWCTAGTRCGPPKFTTNPCSRPKTWNSAGTVRSPRCCTTINSPAYGCGTCPPAQKQTCPVTRYLSA